MKETIKKALIFWLVSSFTMILIWYVYAAVSNTVEPWQTLTASMWNEMAGNYNYSTTEVNTGKKWIDSKPIYRKVVQLPSNLECNNVWHNSTSYINPAANVDKVVHIELIDVNWMVWGARHMASESSAEYVDYWLWKASLWYRLWINMCARLNWANVIMEYTKTTD